MTDTKAITTADLSDRLADLAGDVILLGEAAKSLLADANGGDLVCNRAYDIADAINAVAKEVHPEQD